MNILMSVFMWIGILFVAVLCFILFLAWIVGIYNTKEENFRDEVRRAVEFELDQILKDKVESTRIQVGQMNARLNSLERVQSDLWTNNGKRLVTLDNRIDGMIALLEAKIEELKAHEA